MDCWITTFLGFFESQIKGFIQNCISFQKYLLEGIAKDPTEQPENKKLLMGVMEVLSNHRLATSQLDQNFQFYKDMTLLLRKHQDFKNQNAENKKDK